MTATRGVPPPWVVLACLTVYVVNGGDSCNDMYKAILKRPKGAKVSPAEVGGLYFEYCKKNMKVSSAKSMDDLCAPLVKKIQEKMQWVPSEVAVTPEIACKSVDKLKEEFPEQVAVAEVQIKAAGEDEAKHRQLMEKAKLLRGTLVDEVRTVIDKWGRGLVKDLGALLREKTEEVLGSDFGQAPKQALAKQVEEAASLASRGVETKLIQKLDEAVGSWAALAKKEAREKAKAEL